MTPSASSSNIDTEVPVAKKMKPAVVRGIFELDALKKSFEKCAICPMCQHGLIASFPTCCIATGLRLECDTHSFVDTQRPATTDVPLPIDSGSPLIERNTDYSINVLCVISFLVSGDGGVEAGRLLGFLGLSNSTTMEKRSIAMIESQIGPVLQDLCTTILVKNLEEEVSVYHGDSTDEQGNLSFDFWKDDNLPVALWPTKIETWHHGCGLTKAFWWEKLQ